MGAGFTTVPSRSCASKTRRGDMKVLPSPTDSMNMDRRAFARHRTGAALLLGLSLHASSASAEPAETRVDTMASKTAQELPSAAEMPLIPAAPTVAPRLIRDESVAYPEQPIGELDGAGAQWTSTLADASLALSALRGDPLVIHIGSIDRVDLYLDGDPARFAGEASLRPFDVGGLIKTAFARGGGSLLPALLFLLSPEVKLDYQARATYEPSARDRFSAFGFGSHDLRGEKKHGILGRLGDACRPKITFTW